MEAKHLFPPPPRERDGQARPRDKQAGLVPRTDGRAHAKHLCFVVFFLPLSQDALAKASEKVTDRCPCIARRRFLRVLAF